jgi:regulator of RNase E activity RraA
MLDAQQACRDRLLRLDTAAVSDALDSLGLSGALFGILARLTGKKMAGPAFTVQYQSLDASRKGFQNAANYIDKVPPGAVVVISNDGDTTCTNWGDILTRKAIFQGIAGTVINGSARDIETIRELNYPLFSRGIFMVSGKNRVELKATNVPVRFGDVTIEPGDWIFGDDNGVLVIAPENLQEMIERAEVVQETEINIVRSIHAGEELVNARERFGYSAPWEGKGRGGWQEPAPEADDPVSGDFMSYWLGRLDILDVHYHADPDAYKRKMNAVDAAKSYQALRGGVVLKSHLGCTCAVAATCQSLGYSVFGSTSLNGISGGLNVNVIERALCHYRNSPHCGRLVVDLPTVVATDHRSKLTRPYSNKASETFSQQVCVISGENGNLLPEIDVLLDFCKEQQVVLTTGHATRQQIEDLVDICARKGGVRLLLNQPANPISGMDSIALQALGAHDWLFIEQTTLTYLLGYQTDEDFLDVLENVPNLVYSSDLGQDTQILPDEWWKKSQEWFREAGLKEDRVHNITLLNPLRMLAP